MPHPLQATAGDRLVIVDFFAPWCAACKGIHPKVGAALRRMPCQSGSVQETTLHLEVPAFSLLVARG